MRRSLHFLSPLLIALVAACGTDPQPTPAMDSGAGDTGRPDAVTDTGRPDVDADPPGCNRAPVEDLNMLGMRAGTTLRYAGTNEMALDSASAGIQVPMAFQQTCAFRTTRQRVFQYTLQAEASLRVSTSNAGTDAEFDTTLLLVPQRFCTSNPRTFFCNDDDPTLTGAMARSSSLLTTPVLPAGTTILIGVGGLVPQSGSEGTTGTFELTVQEVPPITNGMMCDRARLATGACATGSDCVGSAILATTGTCQMRGSVVGSPCDGTCGGTGLTCDPMYNICYRQVADGMPCDRFLDGWDRCGNDSTCVTLQAGAVRGVCRPNGTVAGARCNSMMRCTGEGLACLQTGTSSICLREAMRAGPCSTWDSRCPDGQACQPSRPGRLQGTCSDIGTWVGSACTSTGMCPGMGLMCNTRLTTPACTGTTAVGEVCTGLSPCADMSPCFFTDTSDRTRGRCFAPGTEGGTCRTSGTPCDSGLTCFDPMVMGASTRCLRRVGAGQPCSMFGQNFGVPSCNTGLSCVRAMGGTGAMGTCVADGTAAGTACRATGERCNGGLTCTTTRGAGTCLGMTTAACDPRFNTLRCPTGQTCRATSFEAGACAMPGTETEPNDDAAMPQVVATLPASVRGALTVFDVDCYGITVPEGGRVFARVNASSGFCAAGLGLDLYGPDGRLLGTNTNSGAFGCPRIDGADATVGDLFGYAQNLAAGRHVVCVRNPNQQRTAVPDYVLDVNVTPRP